MKTGIRLILIATLIAVLWPQAVWAEENLEKSHKNLIGAYINFIETEELGYGILFMRDFGMRNRFFISLETFNFDEEDRTITPDYIEVFEQTGDSEEIEVGYLRRVSDPANNWSVSVGPSIGVQFFDTSLEMRFSDFFGTSIVRAELDEDPSINVYANIVFDYTFAEKATVFVIGSFGYAFEHDYKMQFDDGTFVEDTTDSDTFWNLTIGMGFSF